MKPVTDVPSEERLKRHQGEIWRYLRFLGCDPALADDLTQDTFLAVLRAPPPLDDPRDEAAYLRTVAKHRLIDARRRRRLEVDLEAAELAWRELAGDDGGAAYVDALRDCLEALDARGREAIDGRYRDQQSRAELAARLGLSEEGVKTLLRRTKDGLRACIEGKVRHG
jgi:RNA polymerase sigma-70 factor, ECF subfamily